MSSVRKRVHKFDGEIEGWVTNFLKTNYWRVKSTMDRDDCMSEAYVVFLRCARKYPDAAAPHFMSLFQSAWRNTFHDLSTEDTDNRMGMSVDLAEVESREVYQRVGDTDNQGVLAVKIRQAPSEVRMVLSLFLNAPQELLTACLKGWNPAGDARHKNGGSGRLNKLLGLPIEQDTIKVVKDYFSPDR